VEEDFEKLGVQEWRELVQDRKKWRDIVMAAKTLRVLNARERRRRIGYIFYFSRIADYTDIIRIK